MKTREELENELKAMTPQEKAKELVARFSFPLGFGKAYFIGLENAKQCALICVDEILKELNSNNWTCLTSLSYWQQVKTEIEKL